MVFIIQRDGIFILMYRGAVTGFDWKLRTNVGTSEGTNGEWRLVLCFIIKVSYELRD